MKPSLAVLLGLGPVLGSAECRPEGPVLPRPRGLRSAAVFQDAVANFSEILTAALDGSINAGFPVQNLSFSIGVISPDQADPGTPLWEYHHLSQANPQGTQTLDRDSQYLIGSITKVLSDYILLKSGLDIDASVTSFIPELANGTSSIQWSQVTLRMLASQLAGVPTNYGFSEYYYLKDVFLSYGFPPIEDSEYPPCGTISLNGGCSEQDFLNGMINSYPITAPMERLAYSNIAFNIFILAIERVTGRNYAQLLDEIIAAPLALQNTLPSPGNDSKAVIPPGDSSWGSDYGMNVAGGGLVSSISDLSKFTHALLTRTLNITETETRAWLKPVSFAGNVHTAVGMPWEIWRPENLTPDHPHHITIYGKGGGAMLYRSQLSVVDEYGVGIVVLTAGQMDAAVYLTNAVLSTIVPVVDQVSRQQAEKNYARRFRSTCANGGNLTIEASLSLDSDSLLLSSIHRDGSDVLASITDLWALIMAQFSAPIGPTVRLYPQDLDEETSLNGQKVVRETWRLWPELLPFPETDLPGYGIDQTACLGWMVGDWVHYGSEPIDRVLFYRGEEGDVVGFEIPFLRSGILRPM